MKLHLLHMNGGLPEGVRKEWEDVLPPERRAAFAAFARREDGDRSLAGDMLARCALAAELAVAPSALAFRTAPGGKPELIPSAGLPSSLPQFNISHAGNLVACVVSRRPVGVDAERADRCIRPAALSWFCSRNELELLAAQEHSSQNAVRLWTLKEAWVKCLGTGIGRYMAGLDLSGHLFPKCEQTLEFEAQGFRFFSFFTADCFVAVCEKSAAALPPEN